MSATATTATVTSSPLTTPFESGAPFESGGVNLDPSAADLLALLIDWPMLLLLLSATGLYTWQYWRQRGAIANGKLAWPLWRVGLFALGIALWFVSTQSQSAQMVAQSMALYMARLMILAEFVPPLLLLGLPKGMYLAPHTPLGRSLSVLFDPWVAMAVWTAVIIFWNVPAGMNASIVSNTTNALPLLYLLSSLMVWGVILRPLPSVQPVRVGSRGWFGLLAALPMMAVASVWLYAREVLYTPYVNALCLWNLSPLQNQQYSGWIMMMAGMPAMALAFVQLMLWLVELSDGDSLTSEQEQN